MKKRNMLVTFLLVLGLISLTLFNYPSDVKENVDNLIKSLNNYLYHPKKGYDIIEEKYLNVVKYRKR